jgi:hypothetical protein
MATSASWAGLFDTCAMPPRLELHRSCPCGDRTLQFLWTFWRTRRMNRWIKHDQLLRRENSKKKKKLLRSATVTAVHSKLPSFVWIWRVNSIKPPLWWWNLPYTTTFRLWDRKPPDFAQFFAECAKHELKANWHWPVGSAVSDDMAQNWAISEMERDPTISAIKKYPNIYSV